ncbi:MAG: serine/threonine protein kinase, partial [Deltaproteobacteria bacterium]|nr:serine/threonine protein kinase [Deltaproteobacteria bacterium]
MRRPVVFGNYLLLERVSVGGMAEVFKAKSFGAEGFEKILAIKRILPSMAEDEDFITMFIDEARICGQLSHANIAQIYELGKIENSHFIALEFVWGKDVLQLQNRFRRLRRRMPLPMAALIAEKVCEGLDYAHRRRDAQGVPLEIIHRDVSPQNVLTSYEGEIKIIDFGIAKAKARSSKTQAGVLKGKFGYMSPEQVRGMDLDRRSDIFAIGTVLWEMCAGERLFTGESDFAILDKVRNAIVPSLSSKNPMVTPELEAIVMRALSRDVEARYQWAPEMQEDLQRYLRSQGQPFGSKNVSYALKELFAREYERERASMEKYQAITQADLAAFANPPLEPPGEARSLLHPESSAPVAVARADVYEAAELLDDADVVPEDFDDGETEMGGPEFGDMPGGGGAEVYPDGATQVFGGMDEDVADAGAGQPMPAEPTFIFNAESGQLINAAHQPTMIFSEMVAASPAGGNGQSRQAASAAGVFAGAAAGSGVSEQVVSSTMPVASPPTSLFKDILIGVLAAAVLILLGIVLWTVFLRGDVPISSTIVLNLSSGGPAEVLVDGRSRGKIIMGKPLTLKSMAVGKHRVAVIGSG